MEIQQMGKGDKGMEAFVAVAFVFMSSMTTSN
jgi:hypothetical protein